jgi:O-antigen ligase
MRLATYASIVEAGGENPVMGIGLNNLRNYLHESYLRRTTLGTAHNSYLAIFAELGAIALLAYLAVMWSICRNGLRISREERDLRDRWRGIALVAMLVAYLVPGLFTHLAYHSALLHLYLFVCAGAVAGRYGSPRFRARNVQVSARMAKSLSPAWVQGK